MKSHLLLPIMYTSAQTDTHTHTHQTHNCCDNYLPDDRDGKQARPKWEAKERRRSAARSSELSKTECDPPPTTGTELTTDSRHTLPVLISAAAHCLNVYHDIIYGDTDAVKVVRLVFILCCKDTLLVFSALQISHLLSNSKNHQREVQWRLVDTVTIHCGFIVFTQEAGVWLNTDTRTHKAEQVFSFGLEIHQLA